MNASLFDEAVDPRRPGAPLAVRMRPATLSELVGQRHLLGAGSPLRRLLDDTVATPARPVSLVLWGPPGTGKTTIAGLVSTATGRRFVELSAVTSGVKDVREVVERARDELGMSSRGTVLFVDEVHRFTKTQQDALLPGVENGWVTLVAATTENPAFSVVAPLLSRSLVLTLESLSDDDIRRLLERAVADPRGLADAVSLSDEASEAIVRIAGGDARRALTSLEAAAGVALDLAHTQIAMSDVEAAVDRAIVRYDREGDQHYDVISGFIKSIRGSDPDAALHYLARMVEAGEDPRFIARRLVVLASEDIGLADPSALTTAVAAADAVAFIGMPEGRIVLAQAVIALACAPKSNAVIVAIDEAIADVRAGRLGNVPAPLRDSHYARAGTLGHGVGYIYPHDTADGIAAQQYAPDPVVDRQYYRPTRRGTEERYAERLERLRRALGRESGEPSRGEDGR